MSGAVDLWVLQRNQAAIAFYEAHGFGIVEADGAGSKEREIDARSLTQRMTPRRWSPAPLREETRCAVAPRRALPVVAGRSGPAGERRTCAAQRGCSRVRRPRRGRGGPGPDRVDRGRHAERLRKDGGTLQVPGAASTLPAIGRLLEIARDAAMKVVFTQDTHDGGDPEWQIWPEHARRGSWGRTSSKDRAARA